MDQIAGQRAQLVSFYISYIFENQSEIGRVFTLTTFFGIAAWAKHHIIAQVAFILDMHKLNL